MVPASFTINCKWNRKLCNIYRTIKFNGLNNIVISFLNKYELLWTIFKWFNGVYTLRLSLFVAMQNISKRIIYGKYCVHKYTLGHTQSAAVREIKKSDSKQKVTVKEECLCHSHKESQILLGHSFPCHIKNTTSPSARQPRLRLQNRRMIWICIMQENALFIWKVQTLASLIY